MNTYLKYLFLTCMGMFLESCNSSTHWVKPTFYLAPQLSSTYRANNIDSSRTEVVIIINPPSNEDSLLK
jgi:hypothetical protein